MTGPVPRPRAASGRSVPPGDRQLRLPGSLLLELVAALIRSGLPPSAAVTAVGRALTGTGDARGQLLVGVAPHLGTPAARSRDRLSDASGGRSSDRSEGRSSGRPGQMADAAAVDDLAEALDLAVRAGVAPAAMVQRAAATLRRRQAVAQQRAVRRLEIWLVAPAGLCWLPAFVLVGVVPLVVDLLRG